MNRATPSGVLGVSPNKISANVGHLRILLSAFMAARSVSRDLDLKTDETQYQKHN